jgi:hypothetical protein
MPINRPIPSKSMLQEVCIGLGMANTNFPLFSTIHEIQAKRPSRPLGVVQSPVYCITAEAGWIRSSPCFLSRLFLGGKTYMPDFRNREWGVGGKFGKFSCGVHIEARLYRLSTGREMSGEGMETWKMIIGP